MIQYSGVKLTNKETNEDKVATATAYFPLKLKDAAIGAGLTLGGIFYMLVKAFKYGAEKYDDGYYDTLNDLGLIDQPEDTKEAE